MNAPVFDDLSSNLEAEGAFPASCGKDPGRAEIVWTLVRSRQHLVVVRRPSADDAGT